MKRDFENYCRVRGVQPIELTDDGCEVELPRSAEHIADFLAASPAPTDNKLNLFKGLDALVDKQGLKVLDFGNWKLTTEPLGGIPPKGGMLRLSIKF
ncbi:MAG TPA: hypothetical protein VN764_06965 [Polyangiaceae bacterium]|nr:hypothetical protein [Polyangiaceae bacterium]